MDGLDQSEVGPTGEMEVEIMKLWTPTVLSYSLVW